MKSRMSRSGRRRVTAPFIAALAAVLSVGALTAAPAAAATSPSAADAASCIIRPSDAADAQPITQATSGGEDEENLIYAFIKDTAKTAGEDETIGGAGWLFNLILGRKGNQEGNSDAQIEQELADQREQLNNIQTSVNHLANQLTNAEFAIKAQLAQTKYDLEVNGQSNNIAHLQGMVQNLCYLAANSTANTNAQPYQPDSADLDNITTIRDDAPAALGTLSNSLLGSGGIIASYRAAWWANQAAANSAAPSEAIWTSDYINSMHNLIDYYVGLAGQVFNGYAEAIHWDSPANPAKNIPALSPADSTKIGNLYDQLRTDIAAWTKAATNDLPAIPDGTAVDVRTGSQSTAASPTTYTMWASSPVTIGNTTALSDGKTHPYCAHTAPLCLYTTWLPSATDTAVASTAVVPALTPVSAALATHPLGLDDWHIPTVKDWTGLVRPSYSAGDSKQLLGLDPNKGVAAWAGAEDVAVLQPQTVAGPAGPVTTIAPVVVEDPTAQVLTFNDPNSATPTAPVASGSVGLAGRLALVRTVTTVPPDLPPQTPVTATGHRSPATGNAAVITGAASTSQAKRGTTPKAGQRVTGKLNQPTTFSTPGSTCTTGYQQPFNANAVSVVITGAAGGSGGKNSNGGQGSAVSVVIPLQPGGVIYPRVGGIGGSSTAYINPNNGNTVATPGRGGTGGGGTGGTNPVDWAGGGGGGLSGISADTACTQWLAVAGGGGGGGGIDIAGRTSSHNDSLNGGNACLAKGCAGSTPTLNGAPATGQGAGSGGDLIVGGGGGRNAGVSAGTGTSGSAGQGGTGGAAINPANPLHEYYGGGGGGGGGGYAGGGGGGASTAAYGGAGGGGGGGYLAEGTRSAAAGIASAGTPAQVVITPVFSPDAQIGSIATNSVPTSVLRIDRDSRAVVRSPDPGQNIDWQSWAFENVGSDGTTPYYLLHNLGSGTCLTNSNSAGQALTSAACNIADPHQAWKLQWQINGTYALSSEWSAGGSALVASAPVGNTATPVTTAPYQSGAPDEQWTLLPPGAGKPTPNLVLTVAHPSAFDGTDIVPLTANLPRDATGTVEYDDVTGAAVQSLGTATVTGGTATLTALTHPLTNGSHTLRAVYRGDASYAATDSNTVMVSIGGKVVPSLSVSIPGVGVPTIADGTQLKPAAHLPGDATGSVQFSTQSYDGTGPIYDLGSAPAFNGSAALTTPAVIVPHGIYIITATYPGDDKYSTAKGTYEVSVRGPAPTAPRIMASPTQSSTASSMANRTGPAMAMATPNTTDPTLASTGVNVVGLILTALTLIGAGIVLDLRRRRRTLTK